MKHQLPSRGRGIDVLGNALEGNLLLGKPGDRLLIYLLACWDALIHFGEQ
jgi:hypothetical protein